MFFVKFELIHKSITIYSLFLYVSHSKSWVVSKNQNKGLILGNAFYWDETLFCYSLAELSYFNFSQFEHYLRDYVTREYYKFVFRLTMDFLSANENVGGVVASINDATSYAILYALIIQSAAWRWRLIVVAYRRRFLATAVKSFSCKPRKPN